MKIKDILTAATLALLFAPALRADIGMQFVTVGDAGNLNDVQWGNYGGVGYTYGIGEYEVTLDQYTAFLNAVAKTDTYGLYNTNLGNQPKIKGIAQVGSNGNWSYTVIGNGSRPVTYVSWFDAARFVNWMHNGQPTGMQTAATTEDGAYALLGGTSGVSFNKSAGAQYWIPSKNEWHKAAYYDPTPGAGGGDNYWNYPTRSDTLPNSRNGSTTDPNSANLFRDDGIANGFNGGFAVTNSTANPADNVLTAVGAFTQAGSYYGTFDQGGNAWEWIDDVTATDRGYLGGSWSDDYLHAAEGSGNDPVTAAGFVGFRVATVPEPASAVLLLGGAALLGLRRRR